MKYRLIRRVVCLFLAFALCLSAIAIPDGAAYAEDNVTKVYKFLVSEMGLNNAAACGVLANIQRESDFNPNLCVMDTNGKYSLGICQWNGGRKAALEKYAGSECNTIEGQLRYLKYELSTSEKNAWNRMNLQSIPNNQEGAGEAARRWAIYFERCAEYYCSATHSGYTYYHCNSCRYQYGERVDTAKNTYWSKFGKGVVSPATSAILSKQVPGYSEQDNKEKEEKAYELKDTKSDTPSIASTKYAYLPGEEAVLIRNKVKGFNYYLLEILHNNKVIIKQSMDDPSITLTDLEEGKYVARVKVGKNGNETITSEDCIFYVQNEVEGVPELSSEKTVYAYNESITLERTEVTNTNYYWIMIWRDDKQIVNKAISGPTYELKHPIEGHYTAYLQVGNTVSGHILSEAYEFDVTEHDHDWSSVVTEEPTCTENGLKTYTCSCLHTYGRVIPATGHVYSHYNEAEDRTCIVCGETEEE